MNTDNTVDTTGVVMPNCAIARRSQISSYKMLQNPDKRKNTKYQVTFCALEQQIAPPIQEE